MSNNKNQSNELKNAILAAEKKEKIDKQIKRLKKLYKEKVDENNKMLVEQLISNIAFIAVELEYTKEDLINKGQLITVINGGQTFTKASPLVDIYIKLVKSYQLLLKQLADTIDIKTTNKNDDPLITFAKTLK